MTWTQQDGYWRRPLDCHDKLFQSIAAAGQPLGREHWFLVGAVQIDFPSGAVSPEHKLRAAWAALRLRHPDVAIELHDDEKRYKPIPNAQALAAWANATFSIETKVTSADELFSRHLRMGQASATCHWVPASRELAIASSHWRWDGRGILMMLHEFMDVLTAKNTHPIASSIGSEGVRLVPTLGVLMDKPEYLHERWLSRANEMLAPMQDGSPSIGLPVTGGPLPGDSCRLEIRISPAATTALLAACRTRRIRLTAALHASLTMETARYHDPAHNDVMQYKSWGAFDLRKYCPPPYDGPMYAPALRVIALPVVVDATADWSSLATSMQAIYEQSFAPDNNDLMYIRVPFLEQATKMLTTAPPTTEPSLSNLGVADNYVKTRYGDVVVRNVWLGVHMLSPQIYVHTWSFKGELHISAGFNEAFYEASFVQQWLEKLKNNLFLNLEVATDSPPI
jgi:hypothetical protein